MLSFLLIFKCFHAFFLLSFISYIIFFVKSKKDVIFSVHINMNIYQNQIKVYDVDVIEILVQLMQCKWIVKIFVLSLLAVKKLGLFQLSSLQFSAFPLILYIDISRQDRVKFYAKKTTIICFYYMFIMQLHHIF